MWHWDQGHLEYFQFDALRLIAGFVMEHDFKKADRTLLERSIGLRFPVPKTHSPWRNYSRVLKLCLLVSESGGISKPTPVAQILSKPGSVTCDEYLHFLVCSFTEPSPALRDWRPDAKVRYPLLFSLKYLLAKVAVQESQIATFDELIGAYATTGFKGDEDESQFISVAKNPNSYESAGRAADYDLRRQARESLKVMAQISYLHVSQQKVIVSLNAEDAKEIFAELTPITGSPAQDRDAEINRLAELFEGGSTSTFFDYPHSIVSEVVGSGFSEGNKVKKTHIVIERNSGILRDFFLARPTAVCDVCSLDTARTYPWTERVIDIHHLLPLCSGTRVEETGGTTFDDLVPVCPSCHRAIHRFYDRWLDSRMRSDFESRGESLSVYNEMKSEFQGPIHV